jgi:cation transport ATPase
VAISEGVFLYYCNATCKIVHLQTIAGRLGDDVPTLDPPAVLARAESLARQVPEVAAIDTSVSVRAEPAENEVQDEFPPEAPEADEVEEAPEEEAPPPPSVREARPPQTMRSPAMSEPDGAPASLQPVRSPPEMDPLVAEPTNGLDPRAAPSSGRVRQGIAVLGGASGVLVPLLALADVGLALRLFCAAVAVASLVAGLALRKRDRADANPAVAAGPVVVALVAAFVAFRWGDPHATSLAVLTGLAAAVAIAAEEVVAHVREEVDTRRLAIVRALQVLSRVARGEAASELRDDVKAGESVLVEAGDVVGVDGLVAAGEILVVPWFGASSEVTKGEGDAVVAGARVVSGRARLVTAWAGPERAWARATSSASVRTDVSAPTARLARALFERGAPAAAVGVGLIAMASGGASGWVTALGACCAAAVGFGARGVVAAVALVHARAQMKALSHGVLYKDARAFDGAGRATIAVVCSRGTVLTGEPEIVALEPMAQATSESHILALAAGAETGSTHPFAEAILRAARTRGVRAEGVRSGTAHAGLGVTALSSAGDRLVVGSRALLLQEKVSVAVAETRASELEAQGRSVLLVSLAGKLVGLLALQDGLRAGARAAVQRLHDARIEPVLLSGESRETCETIARALDIDHVRPEVLPADRAGEVRALAEGGQLVAAIGHPSSDDGALGAAGVSVAMDAAGRPAGEWGVTLASDDVRDAALALSLAHVARDRARMTLVAGVTPGIAALLALLFGFAPLVVGPLAMAVGVGGALAVATRD